MKARVSGSSLDTGAGKGFLQKVIVLVARGDGKPCAGGLCLLDQKADIGVAGQGHDIEGIAPAQLRHHVQCVDPDRAG